MTQLLSADFQQFSPDFFDSPREFHMVGACLFHRGLLLANLMPEDYMIDAYLMLKYNLTLDLTRETSGKAFHGHLVDILERPYLSFLLSRSLFMLISMYQIVLCVPTIQRKVGYALY